MTEENYKRLRIGLQNHTSFSPDRRTTAAGVLAVLCAIILGSALGMGVGMALLAILRGQ